VIKLLGVLSILVLMGCTSASEGALTCSDCRVVPVIRVIAGNTFDTAEGRVRLFSIYTPERGMQCFTEATTRLQELAKDAVRVEAGPRQVDRYGQLLYYVYTEDGDSIDQQLIQEGLAFARHGAGQHEDVLRAAMMAASQAQQEEQGCLWGWKK
jgi:endonuclease YncB( thermonuclease family)